MSTLSTLVNAVNSIHADMPVQDRGLVLAQVIRDMDAAMAKPATIAQAKAPAKARKAKAVKSSPILVRTKNGGNMDSRPGTITTSGKDGGQLGKLIKLGVAMGEPFTATEIKAMRTWSMATASNYRYDLING